MALHCMDDLRKQVRPRDMVKQALAGAGVSFDSYESMAATLPFSKGDVTSGSESELQAVVVGDREQVDLPQVIEQSNYFANIVRRAASGETPRKVIAELEHFLADNPPRVWENSWVRFPVRCLSPFARQVLEQDLLADKRNPAAGPRSDVGRFYREQAGETLLRVPLSYLIKLALADLLGSQDLLPPSVRQTGVRLMNHYLNDNTSPETFSFNVVSLRPEQGLGRAIARETALRFLFTQMLVTYANQAFGLQESGQQAMVYFAPHPPIRQKELNDLVSDSFYRELFMSPCLSGWDQGESKHRYMQLCHQVLSRSQLNGVAKLREAGIITTNLVVLPNVSNVSLANNGTHISIGSRRLSQALADPTSGFTPYHEKMFGDLAIKISEHFLPLFVGTYSAAPLRLSFTDFHPEKALGFLPHELDYTHLRMLWRRWKKKASLSVCGQPVTPFGPAWLDSLASGLFGLKGDFVPDYRLLDYLVCLLSTDRSPSLNGEIGNSDRLRRDLAEMGVFDEQMSVYLLYKQREYARMGFSGFEGRHYSLFESFAEDMGRATDLQTLVTALAFKFMALGSVSHAHIPDTPSTESERRQPFFGAAIDLPTFFVHKDSGNRFLREILRRTAGVRPSRRYPGYLRVELQAYRKALLALIRENAADLIELLNLEDTVSDLERRLDSPQHATAAARLTNGILRECGASAPLDARARDFNLAAENYYRGTLRQRHMEEAFDFLADSCRQMDREGEGLPEPVRVALRHLLRGASAEALLEQGREAMLGEHPDRETLQRLMNLFLITVHHDELTDNHTEQGEARYDDAASIHRAG
ncbi:hypothetical protein [Geobacter sp. SVR]|uniref:hypothetical protein n=1 Tax=Geobacter sp. SVR TaxID=2495594 RepID=UPI00143EFE85|nr:hypothetical protein [Geobacter sp. SVR]BCS53371.1 hypothetical protein GSVR_16790 [Geobacter sp. SVR]GCF85503.1 hypothetical protein GSbR_21030 [Geobacter sp. SVR]